MVTYNPDLGLGLGLVGAIVDRGDGTEKPYRTYFAGQFLLTTRGVHNHQLWVDALRVFGTPLRLQLFANYVEDPVANWFGAGQGTAENLEAGPQFHRYRVREAPGLRGSLGFPLSQQLMLRAGWRVKHVVVNTYSASLLESAPQPGVGSSWSSEATVALTYDTRERFVEPRTGVLHELFLRAASPWWGSTWTYQGVTASLRAYQPVGERFVLAGRILADVLLGDPPFFELVHFGGTDRAYGLGGALSLRGIRMGRYVGKGKLLANGEVRAHFVRFHPFHAPVDLGAVGFVDAGRVFQSLDFQGGGPVFGLGGGLRLIWNESVVLRIDLATPIGDRGLLRPYVQVGELF